MNRRFGAIALAMLLAAMAGGCASPAERPDIAPQITNDEFSPTLEVDGPLMVENPFFGLRKSYQLITYIEKKSHAATYAIEAAIKSDLGDVVSVRAARDDTTTALRVAPVLRGRGGNVVVDIFVAEATLRARAVTGYRVEVIARDGTATVLTITPRMISEQLAAVDQYLRGVGQGPS